MNALSYGQMLATTKAFQQWMQTPQFLELMKNIRSVSQVKLYALNRRALESGEYVLLEFVDARESGYEYLVCSVVCSSLYVCFL